MQPEKPGFVIATTRIFPLTLTWRKARALTRSMSWDEARTRMNQGMSKRLDLARYRFGFSSSGYWKESPSALGNFFFSTAELPKLVSQLRHHLGEEIDEMIQEAEELCCHRFRLLGYASIDYGPEIDWHLDAVHGKRAPLKPWYKIEFLDFSAVGDHKVIWELNRHQHLVTLAKAWVLTGKEKYVTELVRQFYEWRAANPYPLGINWASSLEVAFRSLSWLWVRFLLADCPAVPAAFKRDILLALAFNGNYIERYLSTYFSPNTHLLGEATALFFVGTLCPEAPDAKRWQSLGWDILMREAKRQVRDDGVYFEQSLYYQIYALDFFLHARTLAALNEIEIPSDFDTTVEKMLEVLFALSRAAAPHGFGDDDGGRFFNPRRNLCEHLSDPLATGAILFRREDLASATSLTEEALWLFGDRALEMLSERPTSSRPAAAAFASGGIYVMASSEPQRQHMVIDAGPLGAGRAGHGHADALSVTLSLGGRQWLIDPGTFCYITQGDERDHFRGTSAHNTVMVDGLDQAETEGPFGWRSLPDVHAERWVTGATFTMFTASHIGYRRLPDPVLHRRFIFHLHGGLWLVRDLVQGYEHHRVVISWHFSPDLKIRDMGGAFIAEPEGEGSGDPRLALVPVQDSAWIPTMESGCVSSVYGVKKSAPVVRMTGEPRLPAECATAIIPLPASSDEPGTLIHINDNAADSSGSVRGYRYDSREGSQCMFFSSAQGTWSLGPWTSDAEFIYCNVRQGELAHFILCGGSFAEFSGRPVLAHGTGIERFEWRDSGEGARVFTSDEAALKSFLHDRFRSRDSAF